MRAKSWAVTVRTGPCVWSIITVEANTHEQACATALRLLGGIVCSVV
jgi:hypothetical protein